MSMPTSVSARACPVLRLVIGRLAKTRSSPVWTLVALISSVVGLAASFSRLMPHPSVRVLRSGPVSSRLAQRPNSRLLSAGGRKGSSGQVSGGGMVVAASWGTVGRRSARMRR